jgi:hypothetical protein
MSFYHEVLMSTECLQNSATVDQTPKKRFSKYFYMLDHLSFDTKSGQKLATLLTRAIKLNDDKLRFFMKKRLKAFLKFDTFINRFDALLEIVHRVVDTCQLPMEITALQLIQLLHLMRAVNFPCLKASIRKAIKDKLDIISYVECVNNLGAEERPGSLFEYSLLKKVCV